jgi:hypothetical protein
LTYDILLSSDYPMPPPINQSSHYHLSTHNERYPASPISQAPLTIEDRITYDRIWIDNESYRSTPTDPYEDYPRPPDPEHSTISTHIARIPPPIRRIPTKPMDTRQQKPYRYHRIDPRDTIKIHTCAQKNDRGNADQSYGILL